MTSKEGISMIYGGTVPVGNSTCITKGTVPKPHAVTQYGSIAIDYDSNGNMVKKGSLTYTYDTENRLSRIEDITPVETVSYSVTLKPGWNFFSMPCLPADTKISSVFSSIAGKYSQVSRYDAIGKKYESCIGNVKYDQFNTFEYGRGYQVYINSTTDASFTLTGTKPKNASVALKTGYNLIAALNKQTAAVETALSPLQLNVDYQKAVGYDKSTGKYFSYPDGSLTQFEPGKAYFLKSAKDTTYAPNTYTTFVYDGDGGRVVKEVASQASGTLSKTVYIGSLYELETTVGVTSATKHIFAGSTRICSIEGTIPEVRYYHSDHLGSSNVITDSTGAQAGLTEFTPFGSTFKQTGTYNPRHKFTGKELDASTGLYYYGARYYDPQLGRFISADTIVQAPYDPQSLNRYSYCNNNPINYVDPTGNSWWKSFWHSFVGSFVGGVVTALAMVFSGGSLAPMAPFIFGGVSGAVTGGLSGGWQGALIGAGMGLATAGAAVYGGSVAVAGLLAAGVGFSYARGGLGGVGNFAAGLAGSIIGGTAGFNVGSDVGNFIQSDSLPNLASERGSVLIARGSNAQISAKTPLGEQGKGSAVSSLNTSKSQSATKSQALSSRGSGARSKVKIDVILEVKEPTGYRYVGDEEAALIAKTGYVPNTNARGDPKTVFYSPDAKLTSAPQVQETYNMPYKPTHSVGLDTTQVTNTYGGNGQGINGIEMATYDEIPAVNISPLRNKR